MGWFFTFGTVPSGREGGPTGSAPSGWKARLTGVPVVVDRLLRRLAVAAHGAGPRRAARRRVGGHFASGRGPGLRAGSSPEQAAGTWAFLVTRGHGRRPARRASVDCR